MPTSDPTTSVAQSAISTEPVSSTKDNSHVNGAREAGKQPNPPASKQGQTPTPAELKAQKKAEKALRRQQEQKAREAAGGFPASAKGEGGNNAQAGKGHAKGAKEAVRIQHKRSGSNATEMRNLALRGAQQAAASQPALPKAEDKTVELFRHLYKQRAFTIAGAGKEVHPAVLALGQQMGSYAICGSTARLVATLLALKRVIESYTTPPGNTLSRHLTSHVLSPQIDYLTSCRPLSVSMGTAIRWLKLKISKVDVDEPDAQAKAALCEAIDEFIRDRVTLADAVIAKSASDQCIKDGDVILTYAKSSIVQHALIQAHNDGRKFRVIVVDSRPLFEGKALARALVSVGMDVKYCLMNGLSHCIRDATKVLLGAHAMMSNGRLYSRIGTSQVAMEASDSDIPVIVLCESIKCTERVALDSIVFNEVAPPDELILPTEGSKNLDLSTKADTSKSNKNEKPEIPAESGSLLDGWREAKNLQVLNLMHDVTPADYIAMIVTELGIVPPSSVPVLQRLANESQ